MHDDCELVERLAAIDATPRAGWVAELRADLEAAWETVETGYLDSLRRTTLTLVDDEPTPSEPSSGRRWLILVAAAAAVVAITLVATRDDDATPADQPSPTVTVPATMPAQALFGTEDEQQLAPGTYFVDTVGGSPTPRIFVTLGDTWYTGWGVARTAVIANDDFGALTFSRPVRVFSDACHNGDGLHPGPVTTLDGLVAALNEQRGWADVTAPTDITISGYPGKMFQRTAPANFSGCNGGDTGFRSFENGGRPGASPYSAPGEIETLRVLDVNGTVIVIITRLDPEHQDPAAVAGLAAVLDSIRIQRA